MADEIIDGAPEGAAEVTDLRSTIVAAVEKQRNAEPELDLAPEPEKTEAKEAKPAGDKTETEAERNERLRDDKGRYAAKKETDEPGAPEKAAASAKPDAAAAPTAAAEGDVKPPPGFSPTAKVVWNKEALDKAEWDAVKRDIAKRNDEVDRGFEKYRGVDRYVDMARQSGTTLDKALENYVGIENRLRQDFPAGIAELCRNQGIHPVALANQILARNGVAPSEGQAGETPANQTAPSVDLSPVMQKISALETYITQQQSAGVQTEIQRFASDPKHTFFENVKASMGRLINSGQAETMEDAYDQACWANPEIRALLIKQQTPQVPSANAADAVSKAKAAAKATGGAPSAGFKPNAGTAGASIRDTIRAAVDAQRGI